MSSSTDRRRSFWAWGYEDQLPAASERQTLAQSAAALLGVSVPEPSDPPSYADLVLPPPRLAPPASVAAFAHVDDRERALHTYGKSFVDQLRAWALDFASPPDFVLLPRDESDVVLSLRACGDAGIAVVPFGGGTSVVGGVECPLPAGARGIASLDLRRLDRVLQVDAVSRAARIQAGATGPQIEAQLAAHGLTLRHYPQSFEFSTLGGWLATHAGGHFATVYTHIDDLVQSVRLVTARLPDPIIQTRRLPASGAGPAPERLFLGSEGTLGVFTEAWMRVQRRPHLRSTASVTFPDMASAIAATQAVAQSGLFPSNCRLLDSGEAMLAGAGTQPTLLLGFESAERPVRERLESALALALAHGGACPQGGQHREGEPARSGKADGAPGSSSEAWRQAFLAAPYRQSALLCSGFLADTFETACTWEQFPALSRAIRRAVRDALVQHCGAGHLMMRFTHVYPDGPAPYFTYVAPLPGSHLREGRAACLARATAAWQAIKSAASDAIFEQGGTITHHHAVGRMHRPWYQRESPPLFTQALRAVKQTLDPQAILNPGVLLD
jgi:alkyldihydroxyacetonephosphate synthase